MDNLAPGLYRLLDVALNSAVSRQPELIVAAQALRDADLRFAG